MGNMFSYNVAPTFFLEGLAGERSQSAAENKTASERTFVRFFSTKHRSLRRTVGRWLPKETPIRSAPGWEASTSSRSQGEVHHDGGSGTLILCVPERMKCIGDHPFFCGMLSDLRIRRGPRANLS